MISDDRRPISSKAVEGLKSMTGMVGDVEYQTSPARDFRVWRHDSYTITAKERRSKGRE